MFFSTGPPQPKLQTEIPERYLGFSPVIALRRIRRCFLSEAASPKRSTTITKRNTRKISRTTTSHHTAFFFFFLLSWLYRSQPRPRAAQNFTSSQNISLMGFIRNSSKLSSRSVLLRLEVLQGNSNNNNHLGFGVATTPGGAAVHPVARFFVVLCCVVFCLVLPRPRERPKENRYTAIARFYSSGFYSCVRGALRLPCFKP